MRYLPPLQSGLALPSLPHLILVEEGEERILRAERHRLREGGEAEVPPLEFALAQVAPLGKGDLVAAVGAHQESIAVYEVLRQYKKGGAIKIVRLDQIQILRQDFQHIRPALGDIIRQQLDAVDAHQREYCIVSPLEVRFAVSKFHRR